MEENFLSTIECTVHGVNDVRQTEIHTVQALMPEPGVFEFEIVIEKQKGNKSPGIDHIPAETIKTVCRTIRYEIHKLIYSIWNEEELPEAWKESIILPVYKKGDKTGCSNYRGISLCHPHPKFHPSSCCQG